ncbi:hypothetical protein J4E86_003228 [Alternaria arbusti]|uniref:uncharacterized protein n=1 Tax=Alternaria arbusti TaxID=232088 RepID=UPI00221E3DE1|nr:uncharacterized protein J4E86_003228 [Alternaria arbusti]KAI4959506.1 hypothetical protein J4E86_003228 [Alternaria arbusti]
MTDLINLSARYVIKTDQLGLESALASTPDNDTLVLESVSSDANPSQLWYFEETELDDYYRLHTEDKGNGNSLSTYNYEGSQTTDLRFRASEIIDAQYWRLDVQSDGNVKVSNNRAGSSSYLDIEDGSLKPFLAQGDSGKGEWTLSTFGAAAATPTSTVSTSSDVTTTPDATPSCTSECTAATDVTTADDAKSSGLSKEATIGIAAGLSAAGLLAIIGIAVWLWRRRRRVPSRAPSVHSMRQGHLLG